MSGVVREIYPQEGCIRVIRANHELEAGRVRHPRAFLANTFRFRKGDYTNGVCVCESPQMPQVCA